MKNWKYILFLTMAICTILPFRNVKAEDIYYQKITLKPDWNIISTPRIVDSHQFSVTENSTNFDIYVLDPSKISKWSTMAELNQTEFTPLFGYFINNKTGQDQTLTFNYKNSLSPAERLFERSFSTVGWYSIGGANPTYIKTQNANTTDADNVEQIFSSIKNKLDLLIDFTDRDYNTNRKSVAIADTWKSAISNDLNSINDIRETKGYAVYINDASAKLTGFQNTDAVESVSLINYSSDITMASQLKKGDSNKVVLATQLEANNSDILINKVSINLTGTAIEPWKTFASFDLYIDDQLIKSVDATQDQFIENTTNTDYTLVFDNFSKNILADHLVDLVVKANVQDNPGDNSTYTFKFLEGAIVGKDSANINRATNTVITNNLTVYSTSGTLTFSLSPNSPKTGFIIGNKISTTPDIEIAKFDVKAENRDVTIKTFKTTITDSGSLISAVKLYDGSTLLASAAYVAEADLSGTTGDLNGDGEDASADLVATFSNLAILIAKDTTKTLTIKVDLKPIDGTNVAEGLVVTAGIDTNATAITATDSNDNMLAQAQLNSNTNSVIIGKSMTAYTAAPLLTFVSANITKTVQAGQDDQADATIVFDVTAQGGDIYFKSVVGAPGTIVVDDGMENHNNYDANGGATEDGVGTYTFTSTAEVVDPNTYLVRSGQTARVTISGHITTVGQTGYTNMALDQFIWGTDTTPTEYTIKGITTPVNYDLTAFKTNDVSLIRVSADTD